MIDEHISADEARRNMSCGHLMRACQSWGHSHQTCSSQISFLGAVLLLPSWLDFNHLV